MDVVSHFSIDGVSHTLILSISFLNDFEVLVASQSAYQDPITITTLTSRILRRLPTMLREGCRFEEMSFAMRETSHPRTQFVSADSLTCTTSGPIIQFGKSKLAATHADRCVICQAQWHALTGHRYDGYTRLYLVPKCAWTRKRYKDCADLTLGFP